MNSIKMVALRKHPFGTGEREEGEEYFATPDESAILIALKWAALATESKAEKKVEVEPAAVIDNKAMTTKPTKDKGNYQRRDMKAKG